MARDQQTGLCTLWYRILGTFGGLFVNLWTRYVTCIPIREDTEDSRRPCKLLSRPVPVPDDILVEIFSRTSAECLHQCKQAYEDWDNLCSTPHFNHNLFLPRASPTIIVHRGSRNGHNLFYLDDDHQGGLNCTHIPLRNSQMPLGPPSWLPIKQFTPVKFSCYGLIFFRATWVDKNMSAFINPVTREWTIFDHHSKVKGDICGVYFHPTEREFRLLWVSTWITLNEETYVMFHLLRPISKSHPHLIWKGLAVPLQYRPVTNEPPVNLHERLHWMCCKNGSGNLLQNVMVFDFVKEEFRLICSTPNVQQSTDKVLFHLLDLGGYLSLWQHGQEDYFG
ncbi:putative F-box protein At1g30930 [Apium graveolens]|uniref:putative F-box protein At1g30930 n=1 Tax=Apium graveolens TaxID=4045 RepID=UPI003D78ED6D